MDHPEHTFSWQALGRIVVVGLALLLAWMARGAFVDIIISLILAVSLYPGTIALKRLLGISHIISVLLTLVLLIVPFALITALLLPLVKQTPALLARMLEVLAPFDILPSSVVHFNLGDYMQTHTNAVLASGASVLFLSLSVITIVILAFYFIYDAERLLEQFLDFFPEREQPKLLKLLSDIGTVTGRYVRGNIFISILCVIIVSAGLFLLHVPYAIPLALFAGILDLLPLVGSTIGAIPAVLIAFSISPITGILTIVLFMVYQQVESAFISPIIYNKALNISSTLSFLSVIMGASLFGILGAFLALPVAASIPVVTAYLKRYRGRNSVL